MWLVVNDVEHQLPHVGTNTGFSRLCHRRNYGIPHGKPNVKLQAWRNLSQLLIETLSHSAAFPDKHIHFKEVVKVIEYLFIFCGHLSVSEK